MAYLINKSPFVVPTTDGKLIAEHFGRASSGDETFSLAYMEAPPGWSEPFQQPLFDEITLVISGKKQFEIDGETLVLGPGESILIRKGSRVRYSNPFTEKVIYWSVCVPAFSPETVRRESL